MYHANYKSDQIIIGIDPDLEKSGVAIRWADALSLNNLTFVELKDLIEREKSAIKKVVVEAGWLNGKANYHYRPNQTKTEGERIAKNVGENHATGKLIVQLIESMGVPVQQLKPTRSKLNAKDFNRITGWEKRSNQEQRDAAMLVWGM
ncbi:hypothetical protein [Acinetobacter colistiniresistens]|uniref:Uncharacterized protein n=1 Tax=Acinetobacter colistiniresistens TaxID=280145 RepID=A0A558EXA3_9GAMM|nr:hypothetical protein [Acinetobacter colistiniresistens]TVT77643.1 hypothetical protein FPV60_18555 [Acinetobacter colistiniresistens]